MMPHRSPGSPSASRSQRSVTVSSSVSAGEVRHSIPFVFSAAMSSSARMPACEPVIEK